MLDGHALGLGEHVEELPVINEPGVVLFLGRVGGEGLVDGGTLREGWKGGIYCKSLTSLLMQKGKRQKWTSWDYDTHGKRGKTHITPPSPPTSLPLTSSQALSMEAMAASSFSRLMGSVNSMSLNFLPCMSSGVRYTRRKYSNSSLG